MDDSQTPLRLDPDAADRIRSEIDRAGGREVCFLARVTPDRTIVEPRAVARGNHQAVLAAAHDASPGEILLHNHPSGRLEPSEADLALAARVYEDGLGTGIVDSRARVLYVVVEPPRPRERASLDANRLAGVLAPDGRLADLHAGYEDRPAQRRMLSEVVDRYNEGGVAIVEAGTGTGKTLAYLLPAAAWGVENGERTLISTNTINLQEQLVNKDLPLVRQILGDEVRWTLVKGRGNYMSIRRLHLAVATAPSLFEDDRTGELDALLEWSRKTVDGSLSDLSVAPSPEVWDEVRSDGDICMGARCPHFQACFYQRARREAASADLLVVNHALLFADISLRRAMDNWAQSAVLPPYRHVVLDEGHNVEDAATSHLGAEVTRVGLFRALDRLDRNGKGVLRAVEEILAGLPPGSGGEEARLLSRIRERVHPATLRARQALSAFFDEIEPRVPTGTDEPLRLGRGDPRDPSDDPVVVERLDALTAALDRLRRELEGVRVRAEDEPALLDRLEGRLLDVQAVERRLDGARSALSLVLDPEERGVSFVRWIEGRARAGGGISNIVLAAAPVEPGALLRDSLFEHMESTVVTSATLASGDGDFRFMRERLGLREDTGAGGGPGGGASHEAPMLAFADLGVPVLETADTEVPLVVTETLLSSPFDYRTQAVFCVPTDLPGHDAGDGFQQSTAEVVADMARVTGGGIFVLFTSHRALRAVAAVLRGLRTGFPWPVFVHGEAPRSRLLAEFVRSGRGILLGTASFWEGVDVPGRPLRGLVLQKLPFRVPTEPITQARMEAIEARGGNAFRSYLVPLAALRLKQGFGRLIRSREDRGAIVLLDSRILTRSYGRVLRRSLPDAPLVKGPWERVRAELQAFYGGEGSVPGAAGCLPGDST